MESESLSHISLTSRVFVQRVITGGPPQSRGRKKIQKRGNFRMQRQRARGFTQSESPTIYAFFKRTPPALGVYIRFERYRITSQSRDMHIRASSVGGPVTFEWRLTVLRAHNAYRISRLLTRHLGAVHAIRSCYYTAPACLHVNFNLGGYKTKTFSS